MRQQRPRTSDSQPPAQPVAAPSAGAAATQQPGNANQQAGNVASADPTTAPQAPKQQPAAPSSPTPRLRPRQGVHSNGGAVRLVWDKADWTFYPASKSIVGHLTACQVNDHGEVLTNCNTALRTTTVPATSRSPWS